MSNSFQCGLIAVLLTICAFFVINLTPTPKQIEVSNSRHYPICFHCDESSLFIKLNPNGRVLFGDGEISKYELIDALKKHPEFRKNSLISVITASEIRIGDVVSLTDYIKQHLPGVSISWSVDHAL